MIRRRLFAASFFAAVAGFGVGTASAAEPMGKIVAFEGRPIAAAAAGSRPLEAGSVVFEGDTITVGNGNAQIELDDGTKLVVGPSSRLVLQSYLRRNATSVQKIGIKALRGSFRFITGNSPKKAYDIQTANATIGIRGTGFDFRVDSKTLLAVLEGAVKLKGRNGQSVDTPSGCGVSQAGGNGTVAEQLAGTRKANALKSQLPFIVNQDALNIAFHLPIEDCLTSLGSNDGQPAVISPQQLLPIVPAIAIPAAIIAFDKKNPVSAGDQQCVPVPQVQYYTVCLNPCLPYCGYDTPPAGGP